MSKGLRIFINILETIVAVPLGIVGAILLTPFVLICLLVGLPITIIEDIWKTKILPIDSEAPDEIEKD